MRKLFGLLLVIVTCCVAVLSLIGCSENESRAAGSPDSLQFNVKYYHHKYIHDHDLEYTRYYMFYSNGVCEYYSNYTHAAGSSGWQVVDDKHVLKSTYKVTYKYTYLDAEKSGVILFFSRTKKDILR